MSDGCEIYGQYLLESLLAQRQSKVARGLHQGSFWVGIFLMICAIAPLGLATIVAKGADERAMIAKKKNRAAIDPSVGLAGSKALDILRVDEAPMATPLQQLTLNRRVPSQPHWEH